MIDKLINRINNYFYFHKLKLIEKECLKAFKVKPPFEIDAWYEDYYCIEYIEETILNGYKYIHHYSYGTDEYRIEKVRR